MTKHILLIVVFGFFACSAFATPTVTTDANKDLYFPAKDITLFGHVTDSTTDNVTIQWTRTSGSTTGYTFSAPWAEATTVTFTATGTWVFKITGTDSGGSANASVTVTVHAMSDQTVYYFDPVSGDDVSGTGSATSPWKSLIDGDTHTYDHWQTINTSLSSGAVLLIFPPVKANGTTQNEYDLISGQSYVIDEGQASSSCTTTPTYHPYHLTLDGMSKYYNGTSWVDYTGTTKFKLYSGSTLGPSGAIGLANATPCIRTRGFEVTGRNARIIMGGNYSTLEYINSHDLTGTDTSEGPTIITLTSVNSCTDTPVIYHDVTMRNITVNKGIGEGLYVAGNYNYSGDGGCSTLGDNDYDILIESNNIRDPGYNAPEGEAIDVKAGVYNVTIRANTFQWTHGGPDGPPCNSSSSTTYASGIDMLGQMNASTHDSNYLIEGNMIHDAGCGMTLGANRKTTVRNNIMYNIAGAGIVFSTRIDSGTGATNKNDRVYVYNNTFYNTQSSVTSETAVELETFVSSPKVFLYNNAMVLQPGGTISTDGSFTGSWGTYSQCVTALTSTQCSGYNFYATNSIPSFDFNSLNQTSGTSGIFTNPTSDFRIYAGPPTGPLYQAGLNLTSTGFSNDFGLNNRPSTGAWGIGAYDVTH